QPVRDRRPRDVPARYAQVRVALPRQPDRAVPGAARPLPRSLAAELPRTDLVPGPDPPGHRRPDRPARPGRADRRRALGAPDPACLRALRGRGPRVPRRLEHHPGVRIRAVLLRPGLRVRAGRPDRPDRDRLPRRRQSGGGRPTRERRLSRAMAFLAVTVSTNPAPTVPTSAACLLLIALLLAATGLAIVARKIGIPYPALLVLGGLAIALVPGLPSVELDPDIVFLLFLPPILFAAGYFTSIRDVKA